MKNWITFLSWWKPSMERWMAAYEITGMAEHFTTVTIGGLYVDGETFPSYAIFADTPATVNELMEKLENESTYPQSSVGQDWVKEEQKRTNRERSRKVDTIQEQEQELKEMMTEAELLEVYPHSYSYVQWLKFTEGLFPDAS